MDQLITRFPAQLKEALEIAEAATIHPHHLTLNKVFVAGLGGSGIGADYVKEIIRKESPVPYLVGKGYEIPAYVDQHTLAICSSYSGNTEETLNSFYQIVERGSKVVVVSSGGKLIAEAKERGIDYVQVPDDWPSPRACLGYSIVQQLGIMHKLGFIDGSFKHQVKSATDLLNFDQDAIKQAAAKVANRLQNKVPIIYTTDRIEAVAVRLRQQINENSKMLCWHHVVPEMNHNELVGWTEKHQDKAVVFLRNLDDYKRNQVRMDINQTIIEKYTDTLIEIYSKGNTLIERMFYLTHLGDWTSWYLSELNGVDAVEISVIDFLKGELAKV